MLLAVSMRAAVHGVIRFLPVDGHARSQARSATDWLLTSFVVLVLVAVLAATIAGLSSERRALRSLPYEQRLALLSRTVDELRQSCGADRPAALKGHCRELASFAGQFDECRGERAALVHCQLTPPPAR
jgi:hypothetical protein